MKTAVKKAERGTAGKSGKLNKTSEQMRQNEYKIYKYLKKNPGVFAGSGAAIIAVLSALITFCSYVYESAVLKYWGIESIHISINSENRLYETIAAFIFICMLVVISFTVDMLVEKTVEIRRKILYLKTLKSEHRKENFKIRLRKITQWCLRRTKANLSEDHANKAQTTIKLLEKEVAEKKKRVNRQMLVHLFLLDIVLTASLCILLCVGIAESADAVAIPVSASVLGAPIFIGLLYVTTSKAVTDKKKERERAIHEYQELDIQTDVPVVDLPLKKILSGHYSIKQPDHKIKRVLPLCLFVVIIVIAGLILSFFFLGHTSAKNRTQFMITTQAGSQYAVIYNTGDTVIVAPCKEADDVLIIDASSQKVIPVEGLEYEVQQYKDTKLGSISDDIADKSNSAGVNN